MKIGTTSKTIINKLLNFKGYSLRPEYEYQHLLFKNNEFVNELVGYYVAKNKLSLHENNRRLELVSKLYGTGIIEALNIIKYVSHLRNSSGDFCEFGTANGATAALIANEIVDTKKKLWLYDSFEGLSRPTQEDELINDIFELKEIQKYEGSMSYSKDEVLSRLKDLDFPVSRVKIVKGFIEKTSKKKSNFPEKVAFAYIDFDLYQPIKTALEVIRGKMVKNGVIIIDDYDFFSSGVKKAVDEFVKKNKKFQCIVPHKYEGNFAILVHE